MGKWVLLIQLITIGNEDTFTSNLATVEGFSSRETCIEASKQVELIPTHEDDLLHNRVGYKDKDYVYIEKYKVKFSCIERK